MGDTIQIPIGKKSVDFLIGDCFIEYHPITIKHDLKSWRASEIFSRMYRELKGHKRDTFVEMLTEELGAQYFHRRRQLIDSSPEFKGHDLLLCCNSFDVYKMAIKRFSDTPPRWATFRAEWEELQRS